MDKTWKEKKTFIKNWAAEYVALVKNPSGYYKLFDGSWDFKYMNDCIFSFFTLKRIDENHPRFAELLDIGITYTCTCPQFLHYYVCKHSLCCGELHFEF